MESIICSSSRTPFPIGKGVLVVLDISNPIRNTFEICIENITLSSSQGEALEFEVDNCKKIK